jgi:uncharacterized protein YjbI with pentapeptide repeats
MWSGHIMANEKHVALLKSSIGVPDENEWNEWRNKNPDIRPDLVEARLIEEDLSWTDLRGADLRGASLKAARLSGVDFSSADLREASLSDAYLSGATLTGADLSGALLRGASLEYANISRADFSGANLSDADLRITNAVETNFAQATLTDPHWLPRVRHIRVGRETRWCGQPTEFDHHSGDEPKITVDNIEIAQFIYLLLYNKKIHSAIDTITRKGVLILGRFTPERKAVLDALRDALRNNDYLPILFDFDVPATRDITETITLLARMARFIVADLTDPSSIPKELEAIVPHVAVPVQPLLEGLSRPYAMFSDYWKYDWVLPEYRYERLSPYLAHFGKRSLRLRKQR